MDPHNIATQLIALAHEIDDRNRESLPKPLGDGTWRPLDWRESDLRNLNEQAEMLVSSLSEALQRSGWEPSISAEMLPKDTRWTFGGWTQRKAIREIHHGFLEPAQRRPLVARVPEPVVLYLTHGIAGGDGFLKREQHAGVGWHYHYLDLAQETRMSFYAGTRVGRCLGLKCRRRSGRYSEFHGEGNADFRARPDLWGDTKRHSMHEACRGDSASFGLLPIMPNPSGRRTGARRPLLQGRCRTK